MQRRIEKKDKIEYVKIYEMLRPALKPVFRVLPLFVFGSVIGAVLAMLQPYIYGQIIDYLYVFLTDGTDVSTVTKSLGFLVGIWVIVLIVETLLETVYTYCAWWLGNKAIGDFSEMLYARTLSLSLRAFESRKAGELIRRFDSSWNSLFSLISHFLTRFLQGLSLFIVSVGIGFFIDWRLATVALIPVPLILLLGVINYRFSSPGQQKVDAEWDAITGDVGDVIANITTVKSFQLEKRSVAKMVRDYAKAFRNQNNVNRIWSVSEASYGFIFTFGRLMMFAVGAFLVIQGEISIGVLITFLGITASLFGATTQLIDAFPEMQKHVTQFHRTQNIWHIQPEILDSKNAKPLRNFRGELEFKDVSFSYENGKEVLRRVNVKIPDGHIVAIVGGSGAGKSTLVKLLLRFMDPSAGSVLFDGQDLRDLRLGDVRRSVGFVMQENLLFHDTILNNIKLAKPSASMNQVVAACKRAQAHDFISRLPKGYKSAVGERGVKLSGGEKQRIALARVFLEDPPILVLDEATSALDSKTEHDLQEALKEVMKGRTTVVIAHRLSTVMSADTILVMDKGRVVDQGTHEELIKRGGLYERYWNIQAGGYV